MTTINPTGFCPHCKQNVLLVREKIDVGLAILLLCFTAGIGLIIYLIIYYSKAEDRCVHCGTQVFPKSTQYQQKSALTPYQPIKYQQKEKEISLMSLEESKLTKQKYCVFCGEELENEKIKFCPNCGTKIE